MKKDDILENREYLVSYKYTLPTGKEVIWEGIYLTGKDILSICFDENDSYNHVLISAELLSE